MGRISSGIGLVSGINSKDIIDQLMALESKPKDLLQTRIDSVNQQKLAYTDLQTRLTSLRVSATGWKKPSTFQAADAKSSDENVLTATAANGAAIGSYQIQVARLVSTQQIVSRGYADFNSTKIGAGTITIGQGGGEITALNNLAELNGGAGVRRGVFRITDRSGASALIDISAAVTLQDVIKKINTSLDIQVKATVDGDKIVLNDLTGKTANNLIVQDVGDGGAAADLGLVRSVAADSFSGSDVNYLGVNTSLTQLNDHRGVRGTGDTKLPDFRISVGGQNVDVSLATAKSVGDVLTAINTAGSGKVKAELTAGGNGIKLSDLTSSGAFSVSALNGSKAAADLGLVASTSGATINGGDLLAGLGSVLLRSLNGGSGLSLGTISIQDRASGSAVDVDLSNAKSVQDVLNAINRAPGLNVTAAVNASGGGIQITDTSGGSGNLVIDEVGGGTTAATLGIKGTFDATTTVVNGANLKRAYISENTLLSDYNGGKGVTPGSFKITNAKGQQFTVKITTNQVSLGDVISVINARDAGVTASINTTGNGLQLTDTSGGAGKLKVEEVDGTTAANLNIKGVATDAAPTTIDGALSKTITVGPNDTLATLQTAINTANFGVTASIINDGTGLSPYRLSLTSKNTGLDGRVIFDAGATSLGTHNLVEAQDAAVFLGGAGADQPLLITASQNQITGAIKGVTINLNGVSDGPVNLSVTRSADALVQQLSGFADTFNQMVDKLDDLTKFDTDTNTRGLLLGETTVQTIQSEVYDSLQAVVPAGGKFRTLADVGLSIGDGAKLTFDEDKFREAFADDPDAVNALFTTPQNALTPLTRLDDLNNGVGVRRAPGAQDDLHVELRDGTTFDVNLASADSINDILSAINSKAPAKIRAEIGTKGNLKITDLTTQAGTNKFAIAPLNGSLAALDLGIDATPVGGVLTGSVVGAPAGGASLANAGIGAVIEARINNLIDPVGGAITRENSTLDGRTREFQDRMDQISKLLDGKRTRLEKQFANLESVLANLQSQQQALGQIQTIRAPTPAASSSSSG